MPLDKLKKIVKLVLAPPKTKILAPPNSTMDILFINVANINILVTIDEIKISLKKRILVDDS
jgi:hypothetical protein